MKTNNRFHNPYHFIPIKARDKARDLLVNEARAGCWQHHAHDRYTADDEHFHGRLVCRLTTETPTVIGGQQIEGTEPKQVRSFELEPGKAAIPASTLRGLLSSLTEAVSNSALRVLDGKRPLSFRKRMGKYLSAIGMIIEENGQFQLRPLAIPTMELENDRSDHFKMLPCYAPMYRTAMLKAFIDGYSESIPSGFLLGKSSYNPDNPEYFYAKLPTGATFDSSKRIKLCPGLRFPSRQFRTREGASIDKFLLGQRLEDGPLTEQEWKTLPPNRQADYTRGILRILGKEGRDDIPNTKMHELFIPYPLNVDSYPTFPISPEALSRFHALADERTEADSHGNLPYELLGTRPDRHGRNLRLRHGDLVYFLPNQTGNEVAEVSFSSVWRGYSGVVEDYFRAVDPELLPFSHRRHSISPAELLFGFVQDEKGDSEFSLSFRGKIRVSFGRLSTGQTDPYLPDEVVIKVLSSPKPPSPAFYFKKVAGSGYIAKADLAPGSHLPQGRKMYLHAKAADAEPWKTRHPTDLANQKNRVRPIRPQIEFYFHIDFENLTAWELGLLCYAIKPSECFRHKMGMGKSLGLGTVNIEPRGLFLINRATRYTLPGFAGPRYELAWSASDDAVSMLPNEYDLEKRSATAANPRTFSDFHNAFSGPIEPIDADIKRAIELLGDPAQVKYPVHTPQIAGEDPEKETYRWFVANDKHHDEHQKRRGQPDLPAAEPAEFLTPITSSTPELPALRFYANEENRCQRPTGGKGPSHSGSRPGSGGRRGGR